MIPGVVAATGNTRRTPSASANTAIAMVVADSRISPTHKEHITRSIEVLTKLDRKTRAILEQLLRENAGQVPTGFNLDPEITPATLRAVLSGMRDEDDRKDVSFRTYIPIVLTAVLAFVFGWLGAKL